MILYQLFRLCLSECRMHILGRETLTVCLFLNVNCIIALLEGFIRFLWSAMEAFMRTCLCLCTVRVCGRLCSCKSMHMHTFMLKCVFFSKHAESFRNKCCICNIWLWLVETFIHLFFTWYVNPTYLSKPRGSISTILIPPILDLVFSIIITKHLPLLQWACKESIY